VPPESSEWDGWQCYGAAQNAPIARTVSDDAAWRRPHWTGDGGPSACLLQALALRPGVDELARLVAGALCERTGCPRASLLLPRRGSPIVVDRAGTGAWLDLEDAPPALALSLETGQAVVVGDVSGLVGPPPTAASALVAPLLLGEVCVGLLVAWADTRVVDVSAHVRAWMEGLAAATTLALWGGADAVLASCVTKPGVSVTDRALASPELLAAELRRLQRGDAIAVLAIEEGTAAATAAILAGLVRESDVAAEVAANTVVLLLRHCTEAGAELVLDRVHRAVGETPVRWGVAVAEEGDRGGDLLDRVRAGLSVSGPRAAALPRPFGTTRARQAPPA